MELLRRRDGIDLAFSDVCMLAEIEGIDLAEWIRKHWPSLPVMPASGELAGVKASWLFRKAETLHVVPNPYRCAEASARMTRIIDEQKKVRASRDAYSAPSSGAAMSHLGQDFRLGRPPARG